MEKYCINPKEKTLLQLSLDEFNTINTLIINWYFLNNDYKTQKIKAIAYTKNFYNKDKCCEISHYELKKWLNKQDTVLFTRVEDILIFHLYDNIYICYHSQDQIFMFVQLINDYLFIIDEDYKNKKFQMFKDHINSQNLLKKLI